MFLRSKDTYMHYRAVTIEISYTTFGYSLFGVHSQITYTNLRSYLIKLYPGLMENEIVQSISNLYDYVCLPT